MAVGHPPRILPGNPLRLSWLEANVALALETEEFGPALRDSLERMLK